MRRFCLALVVLFAACTGSASVDVKLELVFSIQPSDSLRGEVLTPFEVQLRDSSTGLLFPGNGLIEISLETDPTGTTTLGGGTQKAILGGKAAFDSLTIDASGIGWELRARFVGAAATDAVSQPFTIRPPFEVTDINITPSQSDVGLNYSLEFTFSSDVAFASVDNETILITDLTTNVGEQARGRFLVFGNLVRFEPEISQDADLSDAGYLPGTVYAISVPMLGPDGVRSTAGDLLANSFSEAFGTRDPVFLPVPGDIADPANHGQLRLFFVDEGIENGNDPCSRLALPEADRDAPQVLRTTPAEGASGIGVVAGTLGMTTYVRLPVLSVTFSEPYSHWRAIAANVVLRNTDTDETFDLSFNVVQSRFFAELAITAFDIDSPFAIDTVPAGNYRLELSNFTDLAGNLLVNPSTCIADGTLNVSFSTVP